ncbi:MAG: SIS domain-containing protein [Rubrivivax sp.]
MTQALEDFLTQIRSLGTLVREEVPRFEPRSRVALTTPEIHGLRQIVIAGSGDSYIAAACAAPAWRAWTGLPVQAMVSMEASRYLDLGRPPRSARARGLLVVAVSSSGEGARLVEAAQRVRRLGAITLALTADGGSRLGRAAEKILDIAVPPSTPAPGVRSYVASLLGLYLLGIRLGEVLMGYTMDEANRLRAALAGLADPLSRLSQDSEAALEGHVERWGTFAAADALGSGPAWGSAAFAAAKLVEAAGVHACAQDAEEFHHLNFFVDRPQEVPALVFAAAGAASSTRTRELVATLQQLGRPHLVVGGGEGFAAPEHHLPMPPAPEFFAPLLHAVPGALAGAYAAEARSAVHYRGHAGPWRGAQGAGLVRRSSIEIDA